MAMSFIAGNSEAVLMDSSYDPPAQGSVCFWIIPTTYATNQRAWGFSTQFESRFAAVQPISAELFSADGILSSALTSGTRYHLTMTWDWDTVDAYTEIYINGVLDNSGNGSLPADPGTGSLSLGVRTGAAEFWTGTLDDFRIYSRILTAKEAMAIATMHGADGIVNGLTHRWLLDEASPGTDASGSGSVKDATGTTNGTPSNTPTYEETTIVRRRAA